MPRCEIIPESGHQAVFLVDGKEATRWHFGPEYPRPFFYPVLGATGRSLTRMGHPGAPNHDHHRSVWFAHHDVNGINFWSDSSESRIRQTRWLVYEDGEERCSMAVELAWEAGHEGGELMRQELVASLQTGEGGSWSLELQSTFQATENPVTLGKTNFGFLAVRMAKQLSAFFGEGTITNSEGAVGEPAAFGKPARWVDYAGPKEGICYFDHPDNPGYPHGWHLREDGWMGCSITRSAPLTIEPGKALRIRHLLAMHPGTLDAAAAEAQLKTFASSKSWSVGKAPGKHRQFALFR